MTGLGVGFVGESGGYVELSYCHQRAGTGNTGWVMRMQSLDYILSSQGKRIFPVLVLLSYLHSSAQRVFSS